MSVSESGINCPSCQAKCGRNDAFCGECGKKLPLKTQGARKQPSGNKSPSSTTVPSNFSGIAIKMLMVLIPLVLIYLWYQNVHQSNADPRSDIEMGDDFIKDDKKPVEVNTSYSSKPKPGVPSLAPSDPIPIQSEKKSSPLISGNIPGSIIEGSDGPPLPDGKERDASMSEGRKIQSLGPSNPSSSSELPSYLVNEDLFLQEFYRKVKYYVGNNPEELLEELDTYDGDIPEELFEFMEENLLLGNEDNEVYDLRSNNGSQYSEVNYRDNDVIHSTADDMPYFMGCKSKSCSDNRVKSFISENIEIPENAIKASANGTVLVAFIVEKNGMVTNARVTKDIGYGCGEESLRVIRKMNENGFSWSPGILNNRPVRIQMTLPVRFQ